MEGVYKKEKHRFNGLVSLYDAIVQENVRNIKLILESGMKFEKYENESYVIYNRKIRNLLLNNPETRSMLNLHKTIIGILKIKSKTSFSNYFNDIKEIVKHKSFDINLNYANILLVCKSVIFGEYNILKMILDDTRFDYNYEIIHGNSNITPKKVIIARIPCVKSEEILKLLKARNILVNDIKFKWTCHNYNYYCSDLQKKILLLIWCLKKQRQHWKDVKDVKYIIVNKFIKNYYD